MKIVKILVIKKFYSEIHSASDFQFDLTVADLLYIILFIIRKFTSPI